MEWAMVLVIILSIFLALFLALAIVLTVLLIKVTKQIKSVKRNRQLAFKNTSCKPDVPYQLIPVHSHITIASMTEIGNIC